MRKHNQNLDTRRASAAEQPPKLFPAVSTSAVFNFLKDTRGALTWNLRDLQDCLNIGAKEGKQILAILQMQGYIQQKEDTDEYLTTAAGESVSRSKLPRMKRESVEEAVSSIVERIDAISRDPRAKFSIRKAVAFGDFLSKRALVQAADVGVMLTRRVPLSGNEDHDQEERAFLKEMQAKNRFVHIQRYQSWMNDRAHRRLLQSVQVTALRKLYNSATSSFSWPAPESSPTELLPPLKSSLSQPQTIRAA